jgi:hypothetical protein
MVDAMKRAFDRGDKTQTRRIVKPAPKPGPVPTAGQEEQGLLFHDSKGALVASVSLRDLEAHRTHQWRDLQGEPWMEELALKLCPYRGVGTLVRVTEGIQKDGGHAAYTSDGAPVLVDGKPLAWRWKVSRLAARYCPDEAVRSHALVAVARLEPVTSISPEDALAEGFEPYCFGGYDFAYLAMSPAQANFRRLFCALNGPETWKPETLVWALTIRKSTAGTQVE